MNKKEEEDAAQCLRQYRPLTMTEVARYLPLIVKERHKYQVGEVVGWAGSPGMPGAALLASRAAFRGGCGIVRLLHPDGMQSELAASPPELIKVPYQQKDVASIKMLLARGNSVFVGPGLGRGNQITSLLREVLPSLPCPTVVDADALTQCACKEISFPPYAILTPHHGEMRQLLSLDYPFLLSNSSIEKCQRYIEQYKVILVLKGMPTVIFQPHHMPVISTFGDPGMATAGMGDVLTGLIAALLAQRVSCYEAALLGVTLHGLAGELAVRTRGTSYGLMASDVIETVGHAYNLLQQCGK